jgi:membrane protease YdiL (CAAX protease family)
VRKHRLIAFFVLAYLLTWWIYPLLKFSSLLGIFGLFGPALAAIIMAAVTEGKAGVKALLSRVVLWRAGVQWYVIALGLPTLLALATAALGYLLGASEFIQAGVLTPIELVLFVLVVGEELGWRGYALPLLLEKRSALTASLILGVCVVGPLAPADILGAWNTAVRAAAGGVRPADSRVLDLDDLGLSPYARQRAHRHLVPRRGQPLSGPLPRRR